MFGIPRSKLSNSRPSCCVGVCSPKEEDDEEDDEEDEEDVVVVDVVDI